MAPCHSTILILAKEDNTIVRLLHATSTRPTPVYLNSCKPYNLFWNHQFQMKIEIQSFTFYNMIWISKQLTPLTQYIFILT